MKKKLLVAVLATISVLNANAFNVKVDNDTDGKSEATTVQVKLFSLNAPMQLKSSKPVRTFTLKSERERSSRFKKNDAPVVQVMVFGVAGAGKDQRAVFTIPQSKRGKNIKIDVDMKQGGLVLSEDK